MREERKYEGGKRVGREGDFLMELFLPTLSKMCELFLYIIIGYIVARFGIAPDNSSKVLSKLENNIFIPALVMGTFMGKFTVER